jgi:hypothetical protein
MDNLPQPRTRAAALDALLAGGEAALPLIERALDAAGPANGAKAGTAQVPTAADAGRLLRLTGQISGPQAISLLRRRLPGIPSDLRHEALQALRQSGYRAAPGSAGWVREQLHVEAVDGGNLLFALEDIGQVEKAALLHRGLLEAFAQVQQRLFWWLSFLHDERAMMQAGRVLIASPVLSQVGQIRAELPPAPGGSSGVRALTLEMLEVTLSAEDKNVVMPLVDARLTAEQRANRLRVLFTIPNLGRSARLAQLIRYAGSVQTTERVTGQNEQAASPQPTQELWARPWLQVCAIYTAALLDDPVAGGAIHLALSSPDPVVRETAQWAMKRIN